MQQMAEKKGPYIFYVDIKYKYFFLKSKKIKRKKHLLNLTPKLIFILKIIALYNMDSTKSSKFLSPDPCPHQHFKSLRFVQNGLNYCKIKEEYYLAYALSNLKFRNQNSFFTHLLLCGDVQLNPGPSGQLCSVCNRVVNKRSLFCSNCNIAVHKKCEKSQLSDRVFLCESCRFADLEKLSFHEISLLGDLDNHFNIAPIENTSDAEDTWKSFERRGLHFIHLNININIAEKTKPAIIGITESKIDETVTETEFDIQGYTPIRMIEQDMVGGGGGWFSISKKV